MTERPRKVVLAREQFMRSGVIKSPVRDVIGQSWERSSHAGVDPSLVAPSYAAGPDESQLTDLVGRVMARMATQLGDEPVSVIFADPTGRVIHRICVDGSLNAKLEKVSLAPGFTYAEETVGTNGIGTALLLRQPTLVEGGEHFTEPLMTFACAGVPVTHPVKGTLLGVLDMTCLSGPSNRLLLSFARSIAQRIEEEILAAVSLREMTLLRDYLAACRQASGPVLALGDEIVMMNRHTQLQLDATDRTALVARTSDAMGQDQARTLIADLPSGTVARLEYRPTAIGPTVIGGVFRIQLREPSRTPRALGGSPLTVWLPGAVGTTPEWQRSVSHLREAHRTGSWVVVEGEPGTGKRTLVRGVHIAESPVRHLRALDAADAAADPDLWLRTLAEELSPEPGTVLLNHVDRLPDELVEAVATLLTEHAHHARSAQGRWVVATRSPSVRSGSVEAQLIPCFDRTIVLEPLRHRHEDVRVIIPALLRGLSPHRELSISSSAVNQLARHPWPGNIAQLKETMAKIVAAKRSGTIELADLPPECMAVGRRTLTPLEALERDAITRALVDHHGNKALAAEHLGLSRATIYRKIRGYNIDTRRCADAT